MLVERSAFLHVFIYSFDLKSDKIAYLQVNAAITTFVAIVAFIHRLIGIPHQKTTEVFVIFDNSPFYHDEMNFIESKQITRD